MFLFCYCAGNHNYCHCSYTVELDEAKDKLGRDITVSISKVSMHGFPATGKTSVVNLAMDQDPIMDHDSTGFAEPPSCSIIVKGNSSEDGKWEMFSTERMFEMLYNQAKTVREHKTEFRLFPSDPFSDPFPYISILPSSSPGHGAFFSRPSSPSSYHSNPSPSQSSLRSQPSQSVESRHVPMPEKAIPQRLKDIINLLPIRAKGSSSLFSTKLILMCDSGGQPHYMDVFPLFVHNKCLALFTLKLNEKLDDIPQFSYCIKGHPVNMSDIILKFSHFKLLESLAKSMSSFLPSLSPSSDCRDNAVIGTFADKVDECVSESLEDQNTSLATSSFLPSLSQSSDCDEKNASFAIVGTFADREKECEGESLKKKNICLAQRLKAYEELNIPYKGKYILPVNAITTDKVQREDYMMALRDLINKSPSITVKIKLIWFGFYLILLSEAKAKQRAIFSLIDCLDIGRSLDMDMNEQETKKAITFFHKLNLIFYFLAEETESCFVIVDLRPIFDLVSHLIGVSFTKEEELLDNFGIDLPHRVKEHFQNHGCFDQEILSNSFRDKFSELQLDPKAFINLLAEVKAIAIINNAIFMPCVLRYAPEEECMATKKDSCPWIVRLKVPKRKEVQNKDYIPLPPSFTPTIIVLLLSSDLFTIDNDDSAPYQYRNMFTLQFNNGDVTIIERQLQLEICYDFIKNEGYSSIRSNILKAILNTKKRLSISDAVKIVESFPCSCTPHQLEQCQLRHKINEQHQYHHTLQPDTLGWAKCELTRKMCELNEQQSRWLVGMKL